MTIILGIDPGSRYTGYGVISSQDGKQYCIEQGHTTALKGTMAERLASIYSGLIAVIETYRPHEAALEQVFVSQNPQTALKLGQARGVALLACANYAIPVVEYTPRQVKQAVVGYGAAGKTQVQHMIKTLFKLDKTPQTDAADALALALCHAHQRGVRAKLAQAKVMAGKGS